MRTSLVLAALLTATVSPVALAASTSALAVRPDDPAAVIVKGLSLIHI